MPKSLADKTLETQRTIFRLAEHDHGWTRKALAADSGINYDTLGTYWRGETIMPLTAFLRLCDLLPDHLLSRLLDPVGRHLAPNEEGPGDLAELGREAAHFTKEFVDSVTDGNVTQIEKAKLTQHARSLRDAASNVVGNVA